MSESTIPPIRAERRSSGDLVLFVDPVALAALEAARAAGGTPSDFGALPSLEELPLRVLGIEARLEMVEGAIGRYQRGTR